MSHGLQVLDAAGHVTWDSNTSVGGVLVDMLQASTSTAVVRTYPAFAGRSARVLQADGTDDMSATVDTALGFPRVTIPVTGGWQAFYAVFCL